MKIINTVLAFTSLLILSSIVQAQHNHEHDDEHDHAHYLNEIGGAVGAVFNLHENDIGTGIHIHYMRMFKGKLEHFGVAPGFETILGDHKHYTFHVFALYRPIHSWWIGIGPGLTYFEHDEELRFSGHIETGYEFELGKIHLGPVVEYAWAKEDQHIMVGIHVGIPF